MKPIIAATIVSLLMPSFVLAAAPSAGSLIKTAGSPAVYYFATDGKRYVFPNQKTYDTWYSGFGGVMTVSSADLSAIPIGGNVTYRPGTRLVKIQSDPKVYAVGAGGVLRWIASESAAAALYGAGWNTQVDDIPDAFFVNYRLGTDIASSSDFDREAEAAASPTVNQDKGFGAPPVALSSAPHVGNCRIFPADNPWNTDISNAPVNPDSDAYIASIGATRGLHPDFGADPTYGIPFDVVGAGQQKVPITFDAYGDESEPGPYPIPANAHIESGGDAHVLVVDNDACKLYELYAARKDAAGPGWTADSGAVFDLTSNALRPETWTSADAAGLPIYPGLVKYDEVKSGTINHAIRFTARTTQKAYIHPATHQAGSTTNAAYPPMGLRVRLKKDFDISGFPADDQVILKAMKTYGMILADNGGSWFFQGEKGAPWDDGVLNALKSVPGSAFEAVDTGPLIK